MANTNLHAALPEVVLLVAASVIEEVARLSMLALVVVAGAIWLSPAHDGVIYAFGGMYVADLMTGTLKLFAVLAVGFMLVYAQG